MSAVAPFSSDGRTGRTGLAKARGLGLAGLIHAGTMVRVRVKLFALAKDLAGSDHLELDLADGATVADVRAALGAACPDLMPLLPQVLIAVDAQYSEESQPVAPANEIACIPPVSGGGITIDTTSRLP